MYNFLYVHPIPIKFYKYIFCHNPHLYSKGTAYWCKTWKRPEYHCRKEGLPCLKENKLNGFHSLFLLLWLCFQLTWGLALVLSGERFWGLTKGHRVSLQQLGSGRLAPALIRGSPAPGSPAQASRDRCISWPGATGRWKSWARASWSNGEGWGLIRGCGCWGRAW